MTTGGDVGEMMAAKLWRQRKGEGKGGEGKVSARPRVVAARARMSVDDGGESGDDDGGGGR